MILDSRLEFSNAEACFGDGTTELLTNQVDMESARDFGAGQPLYLVVVVTTAFAGGTSVEFQLLSDATAVVAVDGTATEHVTTGPIPVATAAAGFTAAVVVPPEGQAYEQFLGVAAKNVGTNTAGAVDAFLTFEPSIWAPALDSGIN